MSTQVRAVFFAMHANPAIREQEAAYAIKSLPTKVYSRAFTKKGDRPRDLQKNSEIASVHVVNHQKHRKTKQQ